MTRRPGGASGDDPIELLLGRDEVRARLQDRVEQGEQLKGRAMAISVNDQVGVYVLRDEVRIWSDYNSTLLLSLFSGPILPEYETVGAVGSTRNDTVTAIRLMQHDLDLRLRKLRSIVNRLDLWPVNSDVPTAAPSAAAKPAIFLVHGHDERRMHEVARVVERSTGLEVTVLHEQADRGRTLIEKFEEHAAAATFAIINLTGDDFGRAGTATDLNPRARQNVVFEMGFFYGALGRRRVVVLLDPGVEKPSDIDGIVYTAFDAAGAWKQRLMREIEAAGFTVDHRRIP